MKNYLFLNKIFGVVLEKIQVLLSAYNGEKYLKEQLDSIRNQSYKNFSLLIRDDGSKDDTVNIVEKYIEDNPEIEIKLIKGENLGVLGSFMKLVELSDDSCSYYSFADQDDIWFEDKLLRAADKMKAGKYLIYSSSFTPVNHKLEEIKFKRPLIKPSFYNSVVENIATGCTIVFSKEMKDKVKGKDIAGASIHDWWFYIVATALGDMFYDSEPSLFYRQHEGNSIGSKDGFIKKWKSRIKRFSSWRKEIFKHLELLTFYYEKELDEEKVSLLNEFLNYKKLSFLKRIRYLKGMKIYRQNKVDNFILKILILFKLIN